MFAKDEKNPMLYCEPCTEKNNKDYHLIINYLKENQGATVMEVITETGASLKSVNCFVEDGSMSYVGSPEGQVIDIADEGDTRGGAKFHTRRR